MDTNESVESRAAVSFFFVNDAYSYSSVTRKRVAEDAVESLVAAEKLFFLCSHSTGFSLGRALCVFYQVHRFNGIVSSLTGEWQEWQVFQAQLKKYALRQRRQKRLFLRNLFPQTFDAFFYLKPQTGG